VHIIQTAKSTTSYGKGQEAGNTYYDWPSWMPIVGLKVSKLPVSVFSLGLDGYEAYDSGRLPFKLDLEAFFRVVDSNVAAQRISSVPELKEHLGSILKGAARSILASKDIEEIMQGRSEFGEVFTKEVDGQLKEWGVSTVKNIELMDIRDSGDSKVIQNIMDKKQSEIERESRVVVAENLRAAKNAEIDAQREVEINQQLAQEQVGKAKANKDKAIGIANETAMQEIKAQQKLTTERQKEVQRVEDVKNAEIQRDVNVIRANEQRQTDIEKAEGEKTRLELISQGDLQVKRNEAEGLKVIGEAKAKAEALMLQAPVDAQISLAKEIGNNEGYQNYLTAVRQLEANEAIGIEQAKALEKADIKVIANGGTVSEGITSISDLFSSKGGVSLGATLEGLSQSEVGKALVDKVTGK
jgi:flotillin